MISPKLFFSFGNHPVKIQTQSKDSDFHVIFEPIIRRRLVVRVLRIHTSSRLLGWFVWIPVVSDRFEMDYARMYGGFIPRHDLHVLSSR